MAETLTKGQITSKRGSSCFRVFCTAIVEFVRRLRRNFPDRGCGRRPSRSVLATRCGWCSAHTAALHFGCGFAALCIPRFEIRKPLNTRAFHPPTPRPLENLKTAEYAKYADDQRRWEIP